MLSEIHQWNTNLRDIICFWSSWHRSGAMLSIRFTRYLLDLLMFQYVSHILPIVQSLIPHVSLVFQFEPIVAKRNEEGDTDAAEMRGKRRKQGSKGKKAKAVSSARQLLIMSRVALSYYMQCLVQDVEEYIWPLSSAVNISCLRVECANTHSSPIHTYTLYLLYFHLLR